MKFENLSYSAYRQKLFDTQFTVTDLVTTFLNRINEGKQHNAFISILEQRALQRAAEIDKRIRQGKTGKLTGLILAVKDNIHVKDVKTTCASRILSNFIPPFSATVIKKLEAEDAIIIGKTNMDEFAMGSSSETSYYGAVHNPVDPECVPGGSSGGSAAAVSAGMAVAALGSDTGGSIRQPAAFCGIVGLKPTYGRVSRFGLVAFASSLDQIGPLATNVEDCARILEVIAGYDERDFTSANVDVPKYTNSLKQGISGLTIGLPDEYFSEGLDPYIRRAIINTVDLLKKNGAEIVPVSLPHTDYAIADYYILATAEASSNLERYDGARYGVRADEVHSLEQMYVKSRSEGFGNEVKRRIMLGTYALAAGYYDKYYRKAQKVRTLIKRDFEKAFTRCDCLITPTSPTTAFKIGEKTDEPLAMYLSDIYTVTANLAGIPGMSIPCGTDENGLPIGLQLLAAPFQEEKIFRIAYHLETLLNAQ
ncbi:Asp-tRNA(Asn)/Glu-tRNA(Gln) amidotransferase subunit GatA [candidate division KSB1 bacterium]|nr:Asp-tRNA(Asn)/Glu-tRNA(Gln) amidotransferase subunit GatA [candidate division KSB1 bacterium]